MAVTERSFQIRNYSGLDMFLSLLPKKTQAVRVAKRLLKGPFAVSQNQELQDVVYVFSLPSGEAFRIRDLNGKVEPWEDSGVGI